ncbi:MAG: VTT domain-containing protein, partial [Oleibacter sp.]|nr:VTT domain-containing protein [Thalassolituus sp.]
MKSKLALLAIIVAAITAYFVFDLGRFLSLGMLQDSLGQLQQWRAEQPILAALIFVGIYVVVTALSIPGAVIMTLAGGAIFGLLMGLVLVSFASTMGATLAMLVARYLLRDSVRNKFSERLKSIDEGLERDGAFYLFTLRLVPVFPFFVINLAMGLTNMAAIKFFWVSQLGMLAGTAVYVNAGTQLAQLESVSGIASPSLILSFVLLGLLPWIGRSIVGIVKRRKRYAGYQKPSTYDRNLIVIGAGSAGLVSAYIAAVVKAKVTLVETNKMGGDCLNYGCVPSKALIKSAKIAHQIQHADQYGLSASQPEFSFKRVMQRVQSIIKDIEPHDSVERYTKLGVDVVQGYANIIDPWRVEITQEDGTKQTLTTRSIIIATGARPFIPELPGLEDVGYLTSDT